MMLDKYFYKSKRWMNLLYPSVLWKIKTKQKELFITFDDGPDPEITPWVMEVLNQYNAKGTFFCLGKNVEAHPEIYNDLIRLGHLTGNHTYSHENGWEVSNNEYYSSVKKCANVFGSLFFRPPYGKIKSTQLQKLKKEYTIVLWSVLSGDYDKSTSANYCLDFLLKHCKAGDIIVFHDSQKAKEKLKAILPHFLESMQARGFVFSQLPI